VVTYQKRVGRVGAVPLVGWEVWPLHHGHNPPPVGVGDHTFRDAASTQHLSPSTTTTQCPKSGVLMPPPERFPELQSRSGHAPWPASITDGHNTLKVVYEAASRALNLDESDPIRLRHYENQTRTVMLSTLQALAACENPPLPERYIEDAADSIRELAGAMATALDSSLER
jgi:hypothetical protein